MSFEKVIIPDVDVISRAQSRTLLQFRNSPLFHAVLEAFTSEVQELVDATIGVQNAFMPADAASAQLDVIGRIVGQNRSLVGYDDITWFAPDVRSAAPDIAPAWVFTVVIDGSYEANDVFYRRLIEAKISRNFMRHCSVPELKRFAQQAFGVDMGFVRVDTMTLQVVVPDETPTNVKNLLQSYFDTAIAEHSYFLPLAAGVAVSTVVTVSEYNNVKGIEFVEDSGFFEFVEGGFFEFVEDI